MPVFEPVRALERGLTILMAVNARDGLRTQELATRTGLPRATVYRLLETLEGMGFVTRTPSDDTWHPTLHCNLLSAGFLDKAWVSHIAMPRMYRLGESVLWPLDLVTFSGTAMLIRETTHKHSPFSFDVGMVGSEIPIMHTAGGHAYLSFCPDEEREEILRLLRQSPRPEHQAAHDQTFVAQMLERTRRAGYGMRSEGYKGHTLSISIPIFLRGRVIAALTVVCMKTAISFDDMVRRFEAPMRLACRDISEELDRTIPPDQEIAAL